MSELATSPGLRLSACSAALPSLRLCFGVLAPAQICESCKLLGRRATLCSRKQAKSNNSVRWVHVVVSTKKGRKAIYDREVRKRIVLGQAKTYEDDVDVTGTIVRFASEPPQFTLSVDGAKVPGRLDPEEEKFISMVRAAVADPELLIRVMGKGAFDSEDTLTRFSSVSDVSYGEDESLKSVVPCFFGERTENRLRTHGDVANRASWSPADSICDVVVCFLNIYIALIPN